MKHTFAAVLTLAALGSAYAQPNAMKAGLWESRTSKMLVDGKDMVPQMKAAAEQMRQQLAKMPADQRKLIEAQMAARGGNDPSVQRMCVSAEMAKRDQPMVPRPPHAECADPKLTRSGNRTEFELSCKQPDGTMTGKGETVVSGDTITSKVETVTVHKTGTKRTLVAESSMRYLGSDCGDIKPLDQLLKQVPAGAAPKK